MSSALSSSLLSGGRLREGIRLVNVLETLLGLGVGEGDVEIPIASLCFLVLHLQNRYKTNSPKISTMIQYVNQEMCLVMKGSLMRSSRSLEYWSNLCLAISRSLVLRSFSFNGFRCGTLILSGIWLQHSYGI